MKRSHSIKNTTTGTAINTGIGTSTSRSSSIRRKLVKMMPINPATTTKTTLRAPQAQELETKIQYDLCPNRNRSNCDKDINLHPDNTVIHTNPCQDNQGCQSHTEQSLNTGYGVSNNTSSEASTNNRHGSDKSRLKRRISLNIPSRYTKSLGAIMKNSNASTSFILSDKQPSPTPSCNSSINGSTSSISTHLQTKTGNMGQKFADFLGIGSTGDTSIRTDDSCAPSASSSMSSIKRSVSGVFEKKDTSTYLNTHKTTLLSKVLGAQHHHAQSQTHSGSKMIDSPKSGDSAMRGNTSWNAAEESRIIGWEMHKSVPPSEYEDEAFALWIRPNIQARTVISGADVENAEKASTVDAINNDEERRKNYRPELEDMKVLEEVLDFWVIILMRASASLYPFIASAHPKSIPINILWRSLQHIIKTISWLISAMQSRPRLSSTISKSDLTAILTTWAETSSLKLEHLPQ
ncbi:hypothetical protein BGZ65_012255 [Modicella reniformis]|uniref:Uncharacterized protein n=1 Tax=Modicella reniformis TaxID=1440133 RepID=A0A9P6IM51_9FUNG|nr:hypothetical protein BGZ65_012255 [Modicella reniformis]